jgi:hypothetical protein
MAGYIGQCLQPTTLKCVQFLPSLGHALGAGGTQSYLPHVSTCDASVTVVSAVATAAEPYSGQLRASVPEPLDSVNATYDGLFDP